MAVINVKSEAVYEILLAAGGRSCAPAANAHPDAKYGVDFGLNSRGSRSVLQTVVLHFAHEVEYCGGLALRVGPIRVPDEPSHLVRKVQEAVDFERRRGRVAS